MPKTATLAPGLHITGVVKTATEWHVDTQTVDDTGTVVASGPVSIQRESYEIQPDLYRRDYPEVCAAIDAQTT